MVEIDFALEVTGDKPEDFIFEIKLGRVINPKETGRGIVSAQYAVKDFLDHGVKADDLIVLEYEMRMTDMVVRTPILYPAALFSLTSEDFTLFAIFMNQTNLFSPIPNSPPPPNNENYYSKVFDYVLPSSNYLIKPNLAAIAKIKNIKKSGIEGTTLFKWCAYYSSDLRVEQKLNSLYDNLVFFNVLNSDYNQIVDDSQIKLDDWFSEVTSTLGVTSTLEVSVKSQKISYHTAIHSIELSTLSYVVSSIISVKGMHIKRSDGIRNESISGVNQVLVAFGKEVSREYKGNVKLKKQAEDLFDLTGSPYIENYKIFDLRAYINSQPVEPVTSPYWSISGIGIPLIVDTIYEDNLLLINTPPVFDVRLDGLLGNAGSTVGNAGSFVGTELIQRFFAKSNIQNITINYGNSVEVKNRTFNCAIILSCGMKTTGNQIYYYYINRSYFNNYNSGESFVLSPTIYSLFDSFEFVRPGLVHQNTETFVVDGTPQFFGYEFGKVFFDRVYNMTMNTTNNVQDQLRTHPNGSYAVFTLPLIAFKQKHSMFFDPRNLKDLTVADGAGTIETEQLILDKIHIVYEYNNKKENSIERFTKDTTHIEMMNKAFNKSLTVKDYEFSLQANGNDYLAVDFGRGVYLGGLSLEKKWENPSLTTIYSLIPNGTHNGSFPYDSSKVIGSDVLCEYNAYDLMLGIANSFFLFTTYYYNTISITYNTLYKKSYLGLYCPTPRMESLFYFSNPYIDRDENNV